MATISALAVRLTLNAAGFSPATAQVAGNITKLGNAAVATTNHFRGLNQEAEKTEGIFQRLTSAVRNNATALLGIAGGGSVVAGIKAAADAEEQFYKNIQGHIGATQTLTTLMGNLRQAVTALYTSFGQAFIDASNLKGGVIEITNVINTLKPIAAGIGAVMGTVAGWFISLGRAILPVIAAFKIFGVVAGIAFKVTHALVMIGLARWVAGFLGLRIGALAFQAAMLLVRAGFVVATYSAAIFHAVSGPTGWAILAGAVAVSAAAVYGLGKAYQYAASNAEQATAVDKTALLAENLDKVKTAAELAAEKAAALKIAYQEALKPVISAFDDVRKQLNTLGLSEAAKKVYEVKMAMLQANRDAGIGRTLTDEQNDALDYLSTRLQELEVRKQMLAITEELASIEKAAAQEGLSKGQLMLDNLRRMGANQEQIAAASKNANSIDAAIKAKKDAEDAAKLMADAKKTVDNISPFDKYKKQIEDIQRLTKVGALKPADATRAMNAAGATLFKSLASGDGFKLESPKALLKGSAEAELAADRARTPIEKLTEIQKQQLEKVRDIARAAREQIDLAKQNQQVVANF